VVQLSTCGGSRNRSGRLDPLFRSEQRRQAATDNRHHAFLKDIVPNDWQRAASLAEMVAEDTRFLCWHDRAAVIDQMIWDEARRMLSNEEITAVINRISYSHGRSYSIIEYSNFASATLAALLMRLDEAPIITSVHHALTRLISKSKRDQDAARQWLACQRDPAIISRPLSRLPGYAFFCLTVFSDDTSESFMARDAFWKAMLGG